MKILITGAKGFVGKNLVASLEAVRETRDLVCIRSGDWKIPATLYSIPMILILLRKIWKPIAKMQTLSLTLQG